MLVERGPLRDWKVLDAVGDLISLDARVMRRGDVVRSVLRNEYQVACGTPLAGSTTSS
jgi:hypothetical protein